MSSIDHAEIDALQLYQRIVERTGAAIAIADARLPDQPLIYVNDAFERLTGYSPHDVIGRNCRFLQGAQKDQSALDEVRSAIAERRATRVLLQNFRKDGRLFWNDLMLAPIFSEDGELTHIFSTCTDASERVGHESQLIQATRRWSGLLDASLGLTFIVSAHGIVTYASGAITSVTGHSRREAVDRHWHGMVSRRDRQGVQRAMDDLTRLGRATAGFDAHIRHANGETLTLQCSASNALDHPDINGLVIVAQDVTARRRAEKQLRYDATHDPLSNLLNRKGLSRRFDDHKASNSAETGTRSAVLLLLDLDQFKALNDSYGHAAGDDFLVQFARRLQARLPASVDIARLGGDEFAILATSDAAQAYADELTKIVLMLSREPVLVSGRLITLTSSVGIAVSERCADALDLLLQYADIALYEAKGKGRNMAHAFDPRSAPAHIAQLSMRRDLPHALEQGQFEVFYQPIVDTRSGQAVSHEMLLRWNHPTMGLLTADVFIGELDALGMSEEVTQWVLNQGLLQYSNALRAGAIRLTLNVWARSLASGRLATGIAQSLAAHGIPPAALQLEITEGEFVFAAQSSPLILNEMAQQGIRILIDDFGKGFSNFGYLVSLPISAIKIDREFVWNIGKEAKYEKLIRSIVNLATDLDIDVIGEGVETPAQRDFLNTIGCHLQQGYLHGRPALAQNA